MEVAFKISELQNSCAVVLSESAFRATHSFAQPDKLLHSEARV